jgi:hypothetical protein
MHVPLLRPVVYKELISEATEKGKQFKAWISAYRGAPKDPLNRCLHHLAAYGWDLISVTSQETKRQRQEKAHAWDRLQKRMAHERLEGFGVSDNL